MSSKSKGSTFERKVAKELSILMFENKDVLKRDPSSGGTKSIWTGDIIPMAQLPKDWNDKWNIHIECKDGYDSNAPTFWKYGMVKGWFDKCIKEAKIHNQSVIYLICHFKGRPTILITNKMIKQMTFYVCFPTDTGLAFVYNYRTFLTLKWSKMYE